MTIQIISTGTLTGVIHWKKCITYILIGIVTVATGAQFKIDKGTKVLLLNDDNNYGQITFNAGSRLYAEKIISYSVDTNSSDVPSTTANNGGWSFTGTVNNNNSFKLSRFKINEFEGSYLGDSIGTSAISFFNMRSSEIKLDELELDNCYNNLYLVISTMKIKKLKIVKGTNAFDFDFSNLTVSKSFNVTILDTGALFTFFYQNSSILIEEHACFKLNASNAGINILFISEDSRVNGANAPYAFNICKLKEELFIFPNIIT